LQKRARLMDAWAEYAVRTPPTEKVVPLRAAANK
jgi:hypothetical protein